MKKKKDSQPIDKTECRRRVTFNLPEFHDMRVRRMPPYYRDYKRTIERFFRNQSFPDRAKKKSPRAGKEHASRACNFSKLVEAMRHHVAQQQRGHKRTLRMAGKPK